MPESQPKMALFMRGGVMIALRKASISQQITKVAAIAESGQDSG